MSCGDAGVLIPISADVDPKTGKADPPVVLGGKPEFLVAAEGKAYVNLVDKDQVAVVDTKTMKVIDKWPTAPGGSPVGMSIDAVHHRLFVGCRKPQKLIVMSSETAKSWPICRLARAWTPRNSTATPLPVAATARWPSPAKPHRASSPSFRRSQTRPGARTMGIDPKTHTLYLPTAEFSRQKDAKFAALPQPGSFMILVVGRSNR